MTRLLPRWSVAAVALSCLVGAERPSVRAVVARARMYQLPLVGVLLAGPLERRGFGPRAAELDRAIVAPVARSCAAAVFAAVEPAAAVVEWRRALGALHGAAAVAVEAAGHGALANGQWRNLVAAYGLMARREAESNASFSHVIKSRVDLSYRNALDVPALLALPDDALAVCSKQFQSSRRFLEIDGGKVANTLRFPTTPDQLVVGPRAAMDVWIGAGAFLENATALNEVERRFGAWNIEKYFGAYLVAAHVRVAMVDVQLGRFRDAAEARDAPWIEGPCAACFDADRGGPFSPFAFGARDLGANWLEPRTAGA